MPFNWTYPQPLDPNKPSLIHGKLRNQIPDLAFYFKEIQNVVDILRNNLGKPAYFFDNIAEIGNPLTFDLYTELINVINILLVDYGFNSVVDILGRNWTNISFFNNKRLSNYQLIQDFRDVLDALDNIIETWEPATISEYTNSTLLRNIVTINGSIGIWDVLNTNGSSVEFGSTGIFIEDHIYILGEESKKIKLISQINNQPITPTTSAFSNPFVSLYPGNTIFTGLAETTFQVDFWKNSYNDYTQQNFIPSWESYQTLVWRPTIYIEIKYTYNRNLGGIYIIFTDLNNVPSFPYLLTDGDYKSTLNTIYSQFDETGKPIRKMTFLGPDKSWFEAWWFDVNTQNNQTIKIPIGDNITLKHEISEFNIYSINIGSYSQVAYGNIMAGIPKIDTELDNLKFLNIP